MSRVSLLSLDTYLLTGVTIPARGLPAESLRSVLSLPDYRRQCGMAGLSP